MHAAFSSLWMQPRQRLGAYRNTLLPLLAGMLSSRGYCGRSPISLRSQKMEVLPQTCMLLAMNVLLRPWPLSLARTQVRTERPLPVLAGDDAVENPTKSLKNPGHGPGVALPARAWPHRGCYHTGHGFGCSPRSLSPPCVGVASHWGPQQPVGHFSRVLHARVPR